MPLSRRILLIVAAVLVLALVAGAIYYFFFRTNTVSLNSYVCEDGSYYYVVTKKNAIEVAGEKYALVSDADGMRYEGNGPMVYTIRGTQIEVSQKESGQVLASCVIGQIESPPIVSEVES